MNKRELLLQQIRAFHELGVTFLMSREYRALLSQLAETA